LQSKKQQHWPPLLLAAYSGDAATTREILDQGDCDVNASAVGGGQKTALYYAVQFNNIEVMQLLLEHPDIDPHKEMKTGGGNITTPLQAAMEMGPQFPAFQEFLARGWITEDEEVGAAEHQLQPLPVRDWNQAQPAPVNDWNQAEEAPMPEPEAPMPNPIKFEDDEEESRGTFRSDERMGGEEEVTGPCVSGWAGRRARGSWWTPPGKRNGSLKARPSRSRTPPTPQPSHHPVYANPSRAPWRAPRPRLAKAVNVVPTSAPSIF
jgi:hypothetical protein